IICLLQLNPTEGAAYNAPGIYWMVTSKWPGYVLGNLYFDRDDTEPAMRYRVSFYTYGQLGFARVYFYNNNGENGANVAAVGFRGYAYHFTAVNNFPGYKYIDGNGRELWITAGSCKDREYEW
ncbi:uncharacterized protein V1513DRAFT_362748, partial [Lipomyces chichibuensis]|uniref:uncharacterized protein n=1 Tax=Lipomyces chichibuensis TaxID=1546026 RepID=UPI003343A395